MSGSQEQESCKSNENQNEQPHSAIEIKNEHTGRPKKYETESERKAAREQSYIRYCVRFANRIQQPAQQPAQQTQVPHDDCQIINESTHAPQQSLIDAERQERRRKCAHENYMRHRDKRIAAGKERYRQKKNTPNI